MRKKVDITLSMPSAALLTALFIAAAFIVVGGCANFVDQDATNFWANMEKRNGGSKL